MATAMYAALRIRGSTRRARLSPAVRVALFGVAEDDQHLFETREIDGRLGRHVLVDGHVFRAHARDAGHRDALREATAHAARDEQIPDLDLVASFDVLDAHHVAGAVARAAHEAARARALDDDVDAEAAVHRQRHSDLFARDA